jgi:hypothetical protein
VKQVREAGLAVIGLVSSAAGKAAVAVEGEGGVPAIPWSRTEDMPWGSTVPVVALTDGVWPRVQTRDDNETVVAGPTAAVGGVERIASYSGQSQGAREGSLAGRGSAPGVDARSPDQYVLALTDAAVNGGREVISLDDGMRGKLASQDAAALAAWRQITSGQEFFKRHRERCSTRLMVCSR